MSGYVMAGIRLVGRKNRESELRVRSPEAHFDAGPAAVSVVDPDRCAMLGRNPPDDGEAEPAAPEVSSERRTKRSRHALADRAEYPGRYPPPAGTSRFHHGRNGS